MSRSWGRRRRDGATVMDLERTEGRRRLDRALVEVEVETELDRLGVAGRERREVLEIHRASDPRNLATLIGAIVDVAVEGLGEPERPDWTLEQERRHNDLVFRAYVGQLRFAREQFQRRGDLASD